MKIRLTVIYLLVRNLFKISKLAPNNQNLDFVCEGGGRPNVFRKRTLPVDDQDEGECKC